MKIGKDPPHSFFAERIVQEYDERIGWEHVFCRVQPAKFEVPAPLVWRSIDLEVSLCDCLKLCRKLNSDDFRKREFRGDEEGSSLAAPEVDKRKSFVVERQCLEDVPESLRRNRFVAE